MSLCPPQTQHRRRSSSSSRRWISHRLENKKEAVGAAKACVDGTGPCDGILDAAAQAALKFNETADTAGNETAADTAGDAAAEPAGP